MIIKSLSRRSKSFEQLLGYMRNEGKEQGKREEIFHNLPYLEDEKKALVEKFEENSEYLKTRKNGVSLYHEIISLHPDDSKRVTPQILKDIADKYLSIRAPESLGYGVVHTNTKNPHIHLMVSANKIASPQKVRLSKAQFRRIKDGMQRYIQKHYPQLKNTLRKPSQRQNIVTPQKEQGMNARNKKDKYLSKKDQIKQIVKTAIDQEKNLPDLEKNLQRQGVELYIRGKQQGVIYQNKKYRLKTLGLAEYLENRKKSWLLVKKRKKSLQSIFLEKVLNTWKSKGFRKKLMNVLEAKKQNKNFLELRRIVERRQRKNNFRRGNRFGL